MTQIWLSLIQRVSATYIAVRPFKSTKQRKRGGPALYARWELQSSLQVISGANPVPGTFQFISPHLPMVYLCSWGMYLCNLGLNPEVHLRSFFTKKTGLTLPVFLYPNVAQLVEHLVEAQGVGSASLSIRTRPLWSYRYEYRPRKGGIISLAPIRDKTLTKCFEDKTWLKMF